MTVPGKPFQSKLTPYRKEIAELRKTWPPTTYKEIATILKKQHGIEITPNSIWSFVKIRALNPAKKVYTLPDTDESLTKEHGIKTRKETTGEPTPKAPANSISENYQRELRKPKVQKPLYTEDNIIR